MHIHYCSLNSHVHPPFWWVWCCGKLLGGLWVWLGPHWVWCCLLDASFVTRDRFFIDFSLKVVLVIFLFVFPLVHYSFCLGVLLGLCFILAVETESFSDFYLHFSFFYIEKYKIVALLVSSQIWIWGGTCIGLLGWELCLGFHIGRIALC